MLRALRVLQVLSGLAAALLTPAVCFRVDADRYSSAERGGQLIGLLFFGSLFFLLRAFINRRKRRDSEPSLRGPTPVSAASPAARRDTS